MKSIPLLMPRGGPSERTYPAAPGEDRPSVGYQYDPYGPLIAVVPVAGFTGIATSNGVLWQLDAANARGNSLHETFGDGTTTSRSYTAATAALMASPRSQPTARRCKA